MKPFKLNPEEQAEKDRAFLSRVNQAIQLGMLSVAGVGRPSRKRADACTHAALTVTLGSSEDDLGNPGVHGPGNLGEQGSANEFPEQE